MKDFEEQLSESVEKYGRYFINPADADMKPMREWMKLTVDLNTLIEVSPIEDDDGEICGFAMHLNIAQLATIKKFHPVIEHLIAKTTKDMVLKALTCDDLEERDEILSDCSAISQTMLKYYANRDPDAETYTETVDEYNQADALVKSVNTAPSTNSVH
jgi:hypothetical protein